MLVLQQRENFLDKGIERRRSLLLPLVPESFEDYESLFGGFELRGKIIGFSHVVLLKGELGYYCK